MNLKKFSQPLHSNLSQTRRVSARLLGFLFVTAAILWVIAGYWFYTQQAQVLYAQKTNELQSIAALKADQIVRWRQERLTDARMNSTSPFFNQALQKWLADPTDDRLTAELLERLQMITVQEEYANVIITDSKGDLLLSADPQVTSLEAETQKLAVQASANRDLRMADLSRSPVSGKVTLAIAAPFSGGQQSPAAVIVFQIDPEEYLYPLIQSWPVPSQSAETLFVQKEGTDALFLNPLRFRSDPPLTIRIPLSETNVPAVQAVLGRTGEFEGFDYRGVKVLANILPIPDTPWFILAKVDQSEILAGVRSLRFAVLSVVFLSLLVTGLLAVYTFNHRHRVLLQNLLVEEQKRRQAQEETRTTLYSIGDGVICTDAAGRVTILNPIAEALTGWGEAEAQGKPLTQIFHIISETTRLRVENPVERVLREGSIVGLANHTLLIHRDGSERPIADSSAPIRSAEGRITGVVLVFRDQTQERAVQRERALLNFTISTSLNEIYLFDAQTLHFRFANDGAIKNLGYSMDQLHAMTPVDIKPEYTVETFRQTLEPLLNHDTATLVFETVHQRADGSRYPVEVHLQLFEYEGEQFFLAVINDITERRQAEEALRKSENIFKKVFEILPIGLWLADKDGTLIQGNPAGVKIWGMEPKVSQSEYDIFKARRLPSRTEIAPDDWSLAHTVNEGVTVLDELLEIDAFDGKTKIILNYSAPILDSSGEVMGAFVVNQDVTERYQAEKALQASEERYHLIDEASQDLIYSYDLQSRFTHANTKMCQVLGLELGQIIGKTHEELGFPKEQCEEWAKLHHKVYETNSTVIAETRTPIQGREPQYFEVVLNPIHDDKGTIIGIAGTTREIDARKKAEIRIEEQLNELKRWQKATLGRESRILELKREVNELLTQMGQKPRYQSPDEGESHHDNLLS